MYREQWPADLKLPEAMQMGQWPDSWEWVWQAMLANEHYELSSLLVNGDEKKESLESGKLTLSNVQENITVSAVFTKKKYSTTAAGIMHSRLPETGLVAADR